MSTNTTTQIEQLCREPDWHAALIVLTSDMFGNDGRVWRHVNLNQKEIRFDRILKDGTFSGGEKRLLEIAASLFNPDHKINLWRALGGLDGHGTDIAIRAIRVYTRTG